jgi:glycosyltransferase involved in cell wall biosynthesis
MRFLFLEPFYGGSHRDFADGLVAHSRHTIDLVTLPDRFWKWRLRGAALYWADRISPKGYDGLIISSLMNLADLKALWPHPFPPSLVYFHENQLTYPAAPGERADHQPGFTNIATALCAQALLFNSQTHLDGFIAALPDFIRIMPDFRPKWVVEAIAQKTAVAHPGCHFSKEMALPLWDLNQPPLIVWNHRWEHDKNPEAFFQALTAMADQGIDFQVALLGEGYAQMPAVCRQAPEQLGTRLVQYGHVPSRRAYYEWLSRGTVVISTALQENFGIAAVEAMGHGCLPLLPKRLSYPEILPQAFHDDFLYSDPDDLETKLAHLLTHRERYADQRLALATAMQPHAWENAIHAFDEALTGLARSFR